MKIIILPHAKLRMSERKIVDSDIYQALLSPDKLEFDKTKSHRFVAKKAYSNPKPLLLLVFYEITHKTIKVITVIQTSKINKYF